MPVRNTNHNDREAVSGNLFKSVDLIEPLEKIPLKYLMWPALTISWKQKPDSGTGTVPGV